MKSRSVSSNGASAEGHAHASSEASSEARRAYERLPFEADVDLVSEHNFYTGLSWNISEGGLFVATHVHHPIGTRFEIRFTLPGDPRPITAIAEVRWSRDVNVQAEVPPGLGLQFVEITEAAAHRIQAFIQAMREPIFYEE